MAQISAALSHNAVLLGFWCVGFQAFRCHICVVMVSLGFAGVNVGKALIDVFGDFVPRGFRIYHAMSAAEFNMCHHAFPSGRVAVFFVCFGAFGCRNVEPCRSCSFHHVVAQFGNSSDATAVASLHSCEM